MDPTCPLPLFIFTSGDWVGYLPGRKANRYIPQALFSCLIYMLLIVVGVLWAKEIKRQKQTVLGWVHDYNEYGPDRIHYQPTGGRQAKLNDDEKKVIETVKQDKPYDHQLPGYGWTLKKLRHWVEQKLGQRLSRTRLRTLLKQAGLSWKKSKKAFGWSVIVPRSKIGSTGTALMTLATDNV